jgi:hypothetical protein
LGIAVVKRKPAALNLHRDPVALQENVIIGVQVNFVFGHLVWRDGFRSSEAVAKAASPNLVSDNELLAIQHWPDT